VLSAPDDRRLQRLLGDIDGWLRGLPSPAPLRGRTLCLSPGWTPRA
jgi:hypothetical protein